ncbi:FKBP-type peptidyl-prolyl cis-trans isomerase [Actinoplanes philippinensis]|uniref:FKBP-type peptidyl-prolyl cis-trans isomerase n=1 Tax=Actinoplanes philippinensis TaxID=35752 RepID=UPI0033C099B2
MPDSAVTRDNASRRAAASPPRPGAPRPPLKTKAEKRAEAKAAKARARAMQKRREMLTIAGAAVAVLALVVGLALWINSSPTTPVDTAAAPSAATDTAAATDTMSKPFPPLPAGADPALGAKPATSAGTGKVTRLKTTTLIEGAGAAVQKGQTVEVNYVGVTYADGKEFDNSWKRKEAFSFQVGGGNVIKGWDEGLIGVKVGSRVQLDIPSDMAYGDNPGQGRPGGALRFVVDVLSAA